MNRIAITAVEHSKKTFTAYISLDEKRDFIDFQLIEPEEASLVDRVYIARVTNILENIQAVFVRIDPGVECYLPMSELEHAHFTKRTSERKPICQGDELIVQVKKDAVKTKCPVVSARLTLAGSYSVLTTERHTLSVSRKLSREQRERGRELLVSLCADHEERGYGVVLRTNSMLVSEEEVRQDVEFLVGRYLSFLEKGPHLAAYTELYRNPAGYIKRLQAARDLDAVYTDVPEIYERIVRDLPYLAEKKMLQFYDDPQVSLATLYNVRGSIDRLLARQVWLPSGANLIIDSVEAMTVIDVNSAKNQRIPGGGRAETILSVNREAAREIARQLRLRNISGIILVDFINMESREDERKLIDDLKSELASDPVPCQFIDITKLGLVELTRKKVHRSLMEMLNGNGFRQ